MLEQTVGERLQALMELRNISQNMLALRSGVKQTTISGIINGSAPRLDTAAALADALGVSLDWLAGRQVKDSGATLTPQEERLLQVFRQFDPEEQALALDLIQTLAKSRGGG